MTHRIVIIGAGYAGLGAAKRAARLLRGSDVRLTLVNRVDRFVERVRLHQLAAGQDLRDRPLSEVLSGTGVELVVAEVTSIDLNARTVRSTQAIGYDTLVYALGSNADLDSVPGVRDDAFSVAEAGQALRLRAHLAGLAPGGVIAVVGGGLTGIEAAAELAEAHPRLRVELVCDAPVGDWLSRRAQQRLRRSLARMGVQVREGARVVKVGTDDLVLADGRGLHADAVVWAAGFRVPALAADAGLATDGLGRMIVDDRLRSVSHPEVYGIGDAVAARTPRGAQARMSCQTGLPMGRYVAAEITRLLAGRAPRRHRVRYVWQNISLGRTDGITQFTRTDDSPIPLVLTGRTSARFKEAITRSAAWTAQR